MVGFCQFHSKCARLAGGSKIKALSVTQLYIGIHKKKYRCIKCVKIKFVSVGRVVLMGMKEMGRRREDAEVRTDP